VIRHEAIGGDADLGLGMSCGQNLFERSVVSGFLKEWESPDTTIQYMIGEISGGEAWTARHAGSCS
jgi:hypothetical protein